MTTPVADARPRARDRLALGWKRLRLLWRSFRSRRGLRAVSDRTAQIREGQVLAFAVVRNEMARLPHFLRHYRSMGIGHFLVVDNASDDGTEGFLAEQPDVSLWSTGQSYRGARFGLDWQTWLLTRHGHGHWCLTVDADELLVYPHWPERDVHALTAQLDAAGARAFGALMIDLFPKGPIGDTGFRAGDDPLATLRWFDASPYRVQRKLREADLLVQGGVRERVFFADTPDMGPTLNKLPLVRWDRRFAYSNSTHSALPHHLNLAYDGPGEPRLCGALLHTKFLPTALAAAREEKARAQHFGHPERFDSYYDAIAANPSLWHEGSVALQDWRQLVALGLISAGGWD